MGCKLRTLLRVLDALGVGVPLPPVTGMKDEEGFIHLHTHKVVHDLPFQS